MLGSTLVHNLQTQSVDVQSISRQANPDFFDPKTPQWTWIDKLNLTHDDIIVNCIGWIPQKASGLDEVDNFNAEYANIQIPRAIEKASNNGGFRVIQIGTDCVFTGKEAMRDESTRRLAPDLYGRTKVQGEDAAPGAMIIRSSIVGVSRSNGASLFDWLLAHPPRARVPGYLNHLWNGVTVLAFSDLISGLITQNYFQRGRFHWVPRDSVSKYELISLASEYSGRSDLQIIPIDSNESKDMRLATRDSVMNERLWELANLNGPQSIECLVADYFQRGLVH